MAVAPIHSQQQWLFTQDLHKFKPVKNPIMEGGGTPEAPPLTEELLAFDGYWRREIMGGGVVCKYAFFPFFFKKLFNFC